MYYNKILLTSNNKLKTSWHIIKAETNKAKCSQGISSINIDGNMCNDYHVMAKSSNTFFTSLTEKIIANSTHTYSTPSNVCPLDYLNQVFSRPFPRINLTPTTAKEIVKSLK